jgi:hypothetical protein
MTRRLPQSTAYTVVFKVFLASDHVSPATGKTVAITLSKAGAAFGNPAAGASNATEIANGWYSFALGTGDTGTLGDLVLVGTATACDSADIVMMVVSATTGGATNLDAAVSSRLAPTTAGRTLDVSVGGEAGLDWNNIGTPSAFANLSGTTVGVVGLVSGDVSGSVIGSVGMVHALDVDTVNASALAADAIAEIKASTVAALTTDTYTEPGQNAPAATASLAAKVGYLYKFMRNRLVNDGTTLSVYADDGVTVDQKSAISVAGSTVTRGEFSTGP